MGSNGCENDSVPLPFPLPWKPKITKKRSLWDVLGRFGRFWEVLGGFGPLWRIYTNRFLVPLGIHIASYGKTITFQEKWRKLKETSVFLRFWHSHSKTLCECQNLKKHWGFFELSSLFLKRDCFAIWFYVDAKWDQKPVGINLPKPPKTTQNQPKPP